MGCAAGWPAATRLNKDVREGGLPKEIPKKLASFTRDRSSLEVFYILHLMMKALRRPRTDGGRLRASRR